MVARREKSGEKVTLELYFSETAHLPMNQCREKKHAAQVELTECAKVQEWELAGMFRGKGDDLIWVIVGNESRKAGESRVHTVQLYL